MSFNLFNELDSLGVIKFQVLGDYWIDAYSNEMYNICVYNEKYVVQNRDTFCTGGVMLTAVGEALRKIIEPIEIDGYPEMIKEYMIKKGVKFANIDDYIIEEKDDIFIVTKKSET